MCISAGAMLAMSAVGSGVSAYTSYQGGKAGAKAMTQQAYNTALDAGKQAAGQLWEADELQKEGQRNAEKALAAAREFRGSQAAAAAAGGILINSPGVQSFLDHTDKLAAADALAISLNASKASTAKRMSAENIKQTGVTRAQGYVSQAESAYRTGVGNALGSMMQAASTGFQSYAKFNAPAPISASQPTTVLTNIYRN